VQFVERRLEEVQKQLNRFKRADEKPFKAVEEIADFNQRFYELFARPFIQAVSNDGTARFLRAIHPLRTQHWAISDLNPWLAWLGPMAAAVKVHRRGLGPDDTVRRLEGVMAELVSASLDFYREMRDAVSEVLFYQTYGNLFSFCLAEQGTASAQDGRDAAEESEHLFGKQVLDSITEGGYPEAVARVFSLLARRGAPFPLAQLHLKRELAGKFADLLPTTTPEQQRHIRGMQDLIVRQNPKRALSTLPRLLADGTARKRLRTLLRRVSADKGVRQLNLAPEQIAMLRRIQQVLSQTTRPRPKLGITVKSKRLMALQAA
jgi:hypothetical protein